MQTKYDPNMPTPAEASSYARMAVRELPDEAPFWDRTVTLGVMVNGNFLAGHAIGDKESMIDLAEGASAIVATWHGTRRSDLFRVTIERLRREAKARQKAKSK